MTVLLQASEESLHCERVQKAVHGGRVSGPCPAKVDKVLLGPRIPASCKSKVDRRCYRVARHHCLCVYTLDLLAVHHTS